MCRRRWPKARTRPWPTSTAPAAPRATANDNGVVDITPPLITVDAPALTNDSTPALTGTTDLPAGSTITLTVTGANGVSQLFSTTVQAGGVFSVDVPAALVSGPFTVSARGTDAAGNTATATDNGVVDTVPPAITVDAPALTNDTTPPLTGTTDLPAGSTITLTVTGANGAVQTFTTTVQAGGVFSVSVPAALVEGGFTVVASGTDAAGNTATASDSGVIDITAPTVTVDAPALTNDTTPHAHRHDQPAGRLDRHAHRHRRQRRGADLHRHGASRRHVQRRCAGRARARQLQRHRHRHRRRRQQRQRHATRG